MGFKCGIVGLPNVGKSTLFNALTQTAAAEAENYPFCTIEPNVGEVPVPDPRLEKIAEIVKPKSVVPTRLTFVDIAGLVRGASKGEGLGNQFLAHIREVDAIAYVLRCFDDPDVTHVDGHIAPLSDAETVETELMLADMESLEKRIEPLEKKIRGQDKEAKKTLELVHAALDMLRDGKPARLANVEEEDRRAFRALNLLTSKRVLYVCNVDEASAATGNAYSRAVEEKVAQAAAQAGSADPKPPQVVVISAKIEAELAQLAADERAEYLQELGLEEAGLDRLIRAGYSLLDLITFFTAGEKEARAWTVREHTKAPRAAGQIHTDFERGFIRAETVSFDEFVEYGGESGARDAGKLRLEGKDYIVQDGDVLHFRFAT
ncbi:MAG: redox-regulated ATPase YchF [Hyphomicrobiaceae bacterium]|nr:redox-regulated ATPase YchF [Hyphomicrobiaceae bacterium]